MLALSSDKSLSDFTSEDTIMIKSKYATNNSFLEKSCISINKSKEKKQTNKQ